MRLDLSDHPTPRWQSSFQIKAFLRGDAQALICGRNSLLSTVSSWVDLYCSLLASTVAQLCCYSRELFSEVLLAFAMLLKCELCHCSKCELCRWIVITGVCWTVLLVVLLAWRYVLDFAPMLLCLTRCYWLSTPRIALHTRPTISRGLWSQSAIIEKLDRQAGLSMRSQPEQKAVTQSSADIWSCKKCIQSENLVHLLPFYGYIQKQLKAQELILILKHVPVILKHYKHYGFCQCVFVKVWQKMHVNFEYLFYPEQ